MLTLNLLPEYQKKRIQLEYILSRILLLAIGVIIILGILTGFGFGVKLFLQNKSEDLEEKIKSEQIWQELAEIEKAEAKIEEFNQLLATIDKIEALRTRWSQVLERLAKTLPKAVRLNLIQMKQSGEINLSGFSPTRDKVLAAQDNLESSPYFTDIYSSPSNWVKKRNIEILFRFKLAQKDFTEAIEEEKAPDEKVLSPAKAGDYIRKKGDYKVFVITESGLKRWLNMTPEEFEKSGRIWKMVEEVSKSKFEAYPTGPDIIYKGL